jgi:ParB family chromosome partitioning protein
MKVIKRSCDLPIAVLHAHPDNPRKDVGDVTELAESIKQNGIFQNLTVVKGGKGAPREDDYTVIIGHRRLTAATRAGLTKVPCMVVDMDDKEQLSTMLLENMQRNDLTIWEQAQGFQMMLDLGETEDDICKKTGFVKQTVRHRLKLLELDPEEFKRAQQRQPTLSDYIELEKIEDIKERNKVLRDIGTNNFKWALGNALREQENRNNAQEWDKFIKSLKIPLLTEDEANTRTIFPPYYYTKTKLTPEIKRKINAEKKGYKGYYISKWGELSFRGDAYRKPNEQKDDWQIKNQKMRERVAKIEEIERQAKALRDKFVKEYVGTSKDIKYLVCVILQDALFDLDIDAALIADYVGIKVENPDEFNFDDLISDQHYLEILGTKTQRVLLAYIAANAERADLHDYFGHYRRNEYLENFYKILRSLDYCMSSQEKQLLDGTHECFEKKEQDDDA